MEKNATSFAQQLLENHISFPDEKQHAPNRVNAELMAASDIREKIQKGIDDVESARVHDLETITRKG